MKSDRHIDPMRDLPEGYKFHSDDYKPSERDMELGFCSYGECNLEDMFAAFAQRQRGVVGGDRTVDDFTPDGLSDEVSGARGNEDHDGDEPGHKYP